MTVRHSQLILARLVQELELEVELELDLELNLGLKLEEVREEVLNLLGAGVDREETEDGGESPIGGGESAQAAPRRGKSKTPALDSFGRDLSELARQKKLDPVIGREREIERGIQNLANR